MTSEVIWRPPWSLRPPKWLFEATNTWLVGMQAVTGSVIVMKGRVERVRVPRNLS